jgi:copper chaperone CopZ
VKVIQGDLRKIETVERGVEGVSAVYISLATKNHKAPFKTELDGTKQIVQALKRQKDIVIAKLSEIDVAPTSLFVDGVHKYRAEEEIKNSGHPYIIFDQPGLWILAFICQKQQVSALWQANQSSILDSWAGLCPYGVQCFQKIRSVQNRIFNIQGSEPLTFEEAAQRFINAYQPTLKITHVPLWVLKFLPASVQLRLFC